MKLPIGLLLLTLPSVANALSQADLFAEVSPSIVKVWAAGQSSDSLRTGSGVVLQPGVIATNCHVVEKANQIVVEHSGVRSPATLLKSDPAEDVCLLKARSATPFNRSVSGVVPIGSLKVGLDVYAIGAPQGLELTMSKGIISALRVIEGSRFIQTDAAISHGSSGGGLFDENGKLVGLTAGLMEGGQNLNFAISGDVIIALMAKAGLAISTNGSPPATSGGWIPLDPQTTTTLPSTGLPNPRKPEHLPATRPPEPEKRASTVPQSGPPEITTRETLEREARRREARRADGRREAQRIAGEAAARAGDAQTLSSIHQESLERLKIARDPSREPSIDSIQMAQQAKDQYIRALESLRNAELPQAINEFTAFRHMYTGSQLSPDATYWLAVSNFRIGQYEEVIRLLAGFAREYPGTEKMADARLLLGVAQMSTGEMSKARRTLREVIESYPGSEQSELARSRLSRID